MKLREALEKCGFYALILSLLLCLAAAARLSAQAPPKEALNADLLVTGATIVTMDADETHTPGLILAMTRKIREGADVVIASRFRDGSRVVAAS